MNATTETATTTTKSRTRKPAPVAAQPVTPACPAHAAKDDKTLLTFKRTRICDECKTRWDLAAEKSDARDAERVAKKVKTSNHTVAAPPEAAAPKGRKAKKADAPKAEEPAGASADEPQAATDAANDAPTAKRAAGGHQVGETEIEITQNEATGALAAGKAAAATMAVELKVDLSKLGDDMMGVAKGAWAVRREFAGAIAIALLTNPDALREHVTWKDVAKVAGSIMAKASPNPYNFLIWALRLNNNETKKLVAIAPGTYALPGSKAARDVAKAAKKTAK